MSAINSRNAKVFHSGPGSPSSYAALENVLTISGPDGTANLIDVTCLTDSGKTYLPDLPDEGTVQVECNFTNGTEQMSLRDNFEASADAEPFKIQIPTAVGASTYYEFYFNAIVQKWQLSMGVGQQVKLTIALKISGGITFAQV